jgi:hypothetical protein
MRIAKPQYDMLGDLSKQMNITRVELLNNVISLAKFLVENKAVSVKAVEKDGGEKEVLLSMLLGNYK